MEVAAIDRFLWSSICIMMRLGTYECGTIIHLPSSRIKRPHALVIVAASDHGLLHTQHVYECMPLNIWISSWLIYVQKDRIR